MIRVALLALVAAVLGCHMGLWEAIAVTVYRVVRCPRCCAFWGVLASELLAGHRDLFEDVAVAITAAYLASWAAPLAAAITAKLRDLWDGWIN
jgi:hypothetical protein